MILIFLKEGGGGGGRENDVDLLIAKLNYLARPAPRSTSHKVYVSNSLGANLAVNCRRRFFQIRSFLTSSHLCHCSPKSHPTRLGQPPTETFVSACQPVSTQGDSLLYLFEVIGARCRVVIL